MLNQWDQPLWCGYSITEKAGGTRCGWCFPWEDFWRHTTTVRSVWRVIAHLISSITLAGEPFRRYSCSQRASRPAESPKFACDHQEWPSASEPRHLQDRFPFLSSPRVGWLWWQRAVSWSKWMLVPIRFWQEKLLFLNPTSRYWTTFRL